MRQLDDIMARLRALQPELRRRYPIRAMGVFGSYVRGEQTADSDLDILVDLDDGMTLPDYAGLQMELSEALGVRVDLANMKALRRRIGGRILAEVKMM